MLQKQIAGLLSILILVVTLPHAQTAHAQEWSPNPEAEAWVLEQIRLGLWADLAEQFPEESERVLSNTFIETLLLQQISDLRMTRFGVRIANAVIVGPLDLRYVEISFAVVFNNCLFDGPRASFYQVTFTKDFSLVGSTFKGEVNLESISADGYINLGGSTFEDDLSFYLAKIAKNLEASGITTTSPDSVANFHGIQVEHSVSLDQAVFQGKVSFYDAEIGVDLDVTAAEFANTEKNISFVSAVVGEAGFFDDAIFAGSADFSEAQFGQLTCINTQFTNPDGEAIFSGVKSGYTDFSNAAFEGSVDLSEAVITGELIFSEAHFNHPEKWVYFDKVQAEKQLDMTRVVFSGPVTFEDALMGGDAILTDSIFKGEASFVDAVFSGKLGAQNAQFTNPDALVTFDHLSVQNTADFSTTNFAGSVSWADADMGAFQLSSAQFTNPDATVSFDQMVVHNTANLDSILFDGWVSFFGATFQGKWNMNSVTFQNADYGVDLSEIQVNGDVDFSETSFAGGLLIYSGKMEGAFSLADTEFSGEVVFWNFHVGQEIDFSDAVFEGGVSCFGMEVGRDLTIVNARFQATEGPTTFVSMNVGGSTDIHGSDFSGGLSLASSQLGNLQFSGVRQEWSEETETFSETQSASIPVLDISALKIQGDLSIDRLVVDKLLASELSVMGSTSVDQFTVLQEVDLSNASFQNLSLKRLDWPAVPEAVKLERMNYAFIKVDTEGLSVQDWEALIAFINRSKFNVDVYKKLENFFTEQGNTSAANQTYISMRQRERKEFLTWKQTDWWWNGFLDLFVGYGRGPERAALWSGLFILLGASVFWRKSGMELQDGDNPEAVHYNPIWFSFDLLMPYLDLGMKGTWRPRADRKFARHYVRLHVILGWLLVPIAVLAIGGLI